MSKLTLKISAIAIAGLLFAACSSAPADNRKFILGSWEGSYQGKVTMYVTFRDDGTAAVDYTPAGGGKVKVHYEFKDDKKFVMDNYPDGLIIQRINDNEVSFGIGNKDSGTAIAAIYECKFRRVPLRRE